MMNEDMGAIPLADNCPAKRNERANNSFSVKSVHHSRGSMKAVEVMSPQVITISREATIEDAARIMLHHGISGLPVVDVAGTLVGIVTEGDFLRRAETGTERKRSRWLEFLLGPGRAANEYVHSHGRKIEEVMTPEVITVSETTPLEDVVSIMEGCHIKRVPVMRGGKIGA
jgi:CBS domain-containing protein